MEFGLEILNQLLLVLTSAVHEMLDVIPRFDVLPPGGILRIPIGAFKIRLRDCITLICRVIPVEPLTVTHAYRGSTVLLLTVA